MDWGWFDCSHSDGCSNWGNSSVRYRIAFRQRLEYCRRSDGNRAGAHIAAGFLESFTGVYGIYALSVCGVLVDLWNLYVDWTLCREKMDCPNHYGSLYRFGCVDKASSNSKPSTNRFESFVDFTPQFWSAGSSMDYRIHAAAIHADNAVFCAVRMAQVFAAASAEMSRDCRVLFLCADDEAQYSDPSGRCGWNYAL